MSTDIEALVKRRNRAYERSVAKTELVSKRVRLYEAANEGFLSLDLVDELDKAQTAESKAFMNRAQAEKALHEQQKDAEV